ncbi:ATP-binding protein, partial [Kitasatospora sp. NPDC059571]|uniref:ATP-binding protein n=1 Tax=Kitasatospora sp. NPDC059571 TaxID=3346871 RepID=UPI0036BFF2C0
ANPQRHASRYLRVVLHADPAAAEAVLEVHDDGPGIAAADRERVFERFARLDDARSRDHGGAGLGLPIARDIAHHHGGTLTAADAPTGALLRTRLPLARA